MLVHENVAINSFDEVCSWYLRSSNKDGKTSNDRNAYGKRAFRSTLTPSLHVKIYSVMQNQIAGNKPKPFLFTDIWLTLKVESTCCVPKIDR